MYTLNITGTELAVCVVGFAFIALISCRGESFFTRIGEGAFAVVLAFRGALFRCATRPAFVPAHATAPDRCPWRTYRL